MFSKLGTDHYFLSGEGGGGGLLFVGFANNFFSEKTCFTQFLLHFVLKTIFTTILKNVYLGFILKNTPCVFVSVEQSHLNENKFTLYKLYAVRWRVSSMVEGIQYGGGYSV